MPNWCHNLWTITGDPVRVRECFEALTCITDKGDVHVTFDKLAPMPGILKSVVAAGAVIDGVRVAPCIQERDPPGYRALTPEEAQEYAGIGVPDWLEWRLQNWGCKWPPGDSQCELEEGFACISFKSAWGPATPHYSDLAERTEETGMSAPWGPAKPLFRRLAERFQDLGLQGRYDNPEGKLAGRLCSLAGTREVVDMPVPDEEEPSAREPNFLASFHVLERGNVIWDNHDERLTEQLTEQLKSYFGGSLPEGCSVDVDVVSNIRAKLFTTLSAVHLPVVASDETGALGEANAILLGAFGPSIEPHLGNNITVRPYKAPEAKVRAEPDSEPAPG